MKKIFRGIWIVVLSVSWVAAGAAAPRDSLAAAGTLPVEEKRDSTAVAERRDSITEARITADKYAEKAARSQTGHKRLEETDFIYGNVVFSSPDLIKALQNLPGVNPGTELMSGLYVHGGEGSDNLFLLDIILLSFYPYLFDLSFHHHFF